MESHARVAREDSLTVSRSRLTVGQEMAASYALYQSRMEDLEASAACEATMERYRELLDKEEAVER